MDYALLAATALGAIGLYLMLPRERAPLMRLGLILGSMALAALFLFLTRAAAANIAGPGDGPPIYFYIFTAIMIASAVGVVCQPRPVYAALYFVLVTLAGAGLFVLLMAEFMAIVLIIIYAGAILVTYVFVIMLASQGSTGGNVVAPAYDRRAVSTCIAITVAFVLIGAAVQSLMPRQVKVLDAQWGDGVTWVDVTKTVQAHVKDGRLHIVADADAFGANVGSHKELRITYQLEGLAPRTQSFGDGATVEIDHLMPTPKGNPDDRAATLMAKSQEDNSNVSNVQVLGISLYSNYGISLELAGILLTIALIGAVVIARKNTQENAPLGTGQVPAE